MDLNRLYSIAEHSGVSIDRADLPKNLSLSLMAGGEMLVALDKGLCGAKEKVCLAHELGHCETASFYNIYAPLDIRGKHERRADRWAIKRLIPKAQYIAAIKQGYDNIFSLSEHFDVTPEFMQKAVEYYKNS